MWFVRFAMDKECRTLACGTRSGHVFVWDPQDLERKPHAKLKREPGNKTTVSLPLWPASLFLVKQHQGLRQITCPALECLGEDTWLEIAQRGCNSSQQQAFAAC